MRSSASSLAILYQLSILYATMSALCMTIPCFLVYVDKFCMTKNKHALLSCLHGYILHDK